MRKSVLRISCKDSATVISAGARQEGRAHVPVDSEAANSRGKATRARTQSANEKDSAANLMQGQRHGYLPAQGKRAGPTSSWTPRPLTVAVKRHGHGHSPPMRNSVLRISCKDSATAISAGARQEGRAHVPVDSEAANSRRKATRARTQSANEKVSAANLMQGQRHGYICRRKARGQGPRPRGLRGR